MVARKPIGCACAQTRESIDFSPVFRTQPRSLRDALINFPLFEKNNYLIEIYFYIYFSFSLFAFSFWVHLSGCVCVCGLFMVIACTHAAKTFHFSVRIDRFILGSHSSIDTSISHSGWFDTLYLVVISMRANMSISSSCPYHGALRRDPSIISIIIFVDRIVCFSSFNNWIAGAPHTKHWTHGNVSSKWIAFDGWFLYLQLLFQWSEGKQKQNKKKTAHEHNSHLQTICCSDLHKRNYQ